MPQRLRVAVVGGSIAGCAAAAELGDAGHAVAVCERSPGSLASHGIGIATDLDTLDRLVRRGLMDPAVPHVETRVNRYVHRTAASTGGARWIGDVASPAATYRWSDLHAGLRARVPDANYTAGCEVAVGADGRLTAAEGDGIAALGEPQLVVFADGHASAGRRFLAPGTSTDYRGLVLWRGLVPETEVDTSPLEGARVRIMYPGGHGVAYLIPGPGGSSPGRRLVLWAFYLTVSPYDLPTVLTGRDGQRHTGSIPLGHTAPAVSAAFRRRLAPVIPESYLHLIDRSAQTAIQAIVQTDSVRSHHDRFCLIGDAAAVFPPFTGNGVLQAIDDAISLRECIDKYPTVRDSLHAWAAHRRITADRVRALAESIHRSLVNEVPDFSSMTSAEAGAWLAQLHAGQPLELP